MLEMFEKKAQEFTLCYVYLATYNDYKYTHTHNLNVTWADNTPYKSHRLTTNSVLRMRNLSVGWSWNFKRFPKL